MKNLFTHFKRVTFETAIITIAIVPTLWLSALGAASFFEPIFGINSTWPNMMSTALWTTLALVVLSTFYGIKKGLAFEYKNWEHWAMLVFCLIAVIIAVAFLDSGNSSKLASALLALTALITPTLLAYAQETKGDVFEWIAEKIHDLVFFSKWTQWIAIAFLCIPIALGIWRKYQSIRTPWVAIIIALTAAVSLPIIISRLPSDKWWIYVTLPAIALHNFMTARTGYALFAGKETPGFWATVLSITFLGVVIGTAGKFNKIKINIQKEG